MIRNQSVTQLFRASQDSKNVPYQLRELCYGRGYTLIDGQQVQLGLCTNELNEKAQLPTIDDNTQQNN